MNQEPIEPEGEVSRELQRLWQEESRAMQALPSESLDDADARTRTAVHWLQAACAEEARRVPAAELPEWVGQQNPANRPAWRSRPAQLAYVTGAFAAAAALFLIQRTPVEAPPEPASTVVGELDPPPQDILEIDPTEPAFQGERTVARQDHVELVKGRVRIVLLRPQREVTVHSSR